MLRSRASVELLTSMGHFRWSFSLIHRTFAAIRIMTRHDMKTCITLLFLLCTSLAGATNYYISPTGNDANSGTSQAQAWRTIARLNQSLFAFQPGDQVLFQRGATFRGRITFGSSGTTNSPIIIGAYGTGAQPIISGSDVVTGWTVHQGNIWKAPVATPVKHLSTTGSS